MRGTDFDNAPPLEAATVERPEVRERPKATEQPKATERPKATEQPKARAQLEAREERTRNVTQDITLNDISDFNTRNKVADLMAVAPVLPVRDLHNFLNEVDGDLEAARQHAISASRAPSVHHAIKREWTPWVPPTDETFWLQAGDDDDEVMIKIDPNEPFLEWVSSNLPITNKPLLTPRATIGLGLAPTRDGRTSQLRRQSPRKSSSQKPPEHWHQKKLSNRSSEQKSAKKFDRWDVRCPRSRCSSRY